MKKEFNFVLCTSSDLTVFKATELGEGGLYRVSWDNDKEFTLYRPEHVKSHLDKGNWIEVD
ncbi:hypothetical protein X915_gp082 [Bacillus phage vB_BanS-Tsamsa]|uniref:Uncharacterized protein n=1 Tax=Bacillus phage vB_BanS-Tsamsa TaxID=1308863 RepID=U5J9J0_9CAUD|nr:hypothetical protein X915_gp082 [Bacillus phage vB_BanS-Tsamsa]AGI11952.1 hypothetical protein [Bacillus phage vB_BanS-Tsamsa]